MIKIHEKKLFLICSILLTCSMVFSIVIGTISIKDLWINETMGNNFFELFYFLIHLIINIFVLVLFVLALKKGSQLLVQISLTDYKKENNFLKIFGLIILIIGLLSFVYFLLVYLGVDLYYFHFPVMLVVDILCSGFVMFVIGLALYFYPICYKKDIKLFEKKGDLYEKI